MLCKMPGSEVDEIILHGRLFDLGYPDGGESKVKPPFYDNEVMSQGVSITLFVRNAD